jgi:hypothetical protein
MQVAPLVATVAASMLVAASATASPPEERHRSCAAAGQFTATFARESGRAFGEFSSELARKGLRDDFVHGLHAALCEPHD